MGYGNYRRPPFRLAGTGRGSRVGAGGRLHIRYAGGAVQALTWNGEGLPLPNGIYDSCAFFFGKFGYENFGWVVAKVRAGVETFKSLPEPPILTEKEKREMLARWKEAMLPSLRPLFSSTIRRAPTMRLLWKALPEEIREEVFDNHERNFRDFLRARAQEGDEAPVFRVRCHSSRFLLAETVPESGYIASSRNNPRSLFRLKESNAAAARKGYIASSQTRSRESYARAGKLGGLAGRGTEATRQKTKHAACTRWARARSGVDSNPSGSTSPDSTS